MYISPDEFARIANLSGLIADKAGWLLDKAEVEQDEQAARAMIARAREFMQISVQIFETLDSVAQTNAPARKGVFDRMAPSLRHTIEQYVKTPI